MYISIYVRECNCALVFLPPSSHGVSLENKAAMGMSFFATKIYATQ